MSAMKGKLTMKIMLGMLLNLLDSLDQIVNVEAKSLIGVLKDLFTKLHGKDGNTWLEELKKFLRKEECWVMTALQRLIAIGKYDLVNPNITDKNFLVPENFVLGTDPKIFHFNRSIKSEDVIKEMDKEGYCSAMIWDLLDYGAKNPEEQRDFPIVGLGSVGGVISGGRSVPYLYGGGSERSLLLSFWDGDWGEECCFLGVRKKVAQASAA